MTFLHWFPVCLVRGSTSSFKASCYRWSWFRTEGKKAGNEGNIIRYRSVAEVLRIWNCRNVFSCIFSPVTLNIKRWQFKRCIASLQVNHFNDCPNLCYKHSFRIVHLYRMCHLLGSVSYTYAKLYAGSIFTLNINFISILGLQIAIWRLITLSSHCKQQLTFFIALCYLFFHQAQL